MSQSAAEDAITYAFEEPNIRSNELNKLVKEALKDERINTPKEVSEYVLRHASPEQLMMIVDEVIYAAVQVRMVTSRHTTRRPGSSKWDAAAESLLSARFCITENNWKQLRHCTIEDVLVIAENRKEQADSLYTQATAFTRLAQLMDDEGVELVDDLDPDEVAEVIA